MARRHLNQKKWAPTLRYTEPFKALGEPHRLMVFNRIARHGAPIPMQELLKHFGANKSVMSRVITLLEDAKLVRRITSHDRTVTVEVNMSTLRLIAGLLVSTHQALLPPKAGAP